MDDPVHVTCPECGYFQVVNGDGDRVAAEYVVEHGRETGHILAIERVADSADSAREASVQ